MSFPGAGELPIDIERINEATGGDAEFLSELVEIFLEDAELRVDEIKGAVASGDPTELKKTAHKLKGSSANMGANGLMSVAKTLEEMGNSGAVSGADGHLDFLAEELIRVKSALEKLVAEGA